MGSKEGKVSKTNVTAREKSIQNKRDLVLVFESYRKPNGAWGLRRHWEDA
jgi:hypothetical protein